MNNNMLISVVVVVLIIVLLVFLSNNSKNKKIENDVNKNENVLEDKSETLIDGNFSFLPNESQIKWEGKKTLIKDWVDSGFISLTSGFINTKGGSPVSGNIVMDMNSIRATKTGANTGEDKLSTHLKSADFFDVNTFPNSEFKVTKIILNENKTYQITGDVTIKGITKSIEFPVAIYSKDNKIFLNGEIFINRTDFNIRYGSKSFFNDLGDNVIDYSFVLKLSLVAEKQS